MRICALTGLLVNLLCAQGSLLLVGGGTENYHSWSDEPYGWFVQQADSGIIINIDTSPTSDWYPNYFQWLGADSASTNLQIATTAAANDSAIYQQLTTATGIFIEGGDQWPYVDTWKCTLVEDAINQVFAAGGAIGGTSAGLAILGEVVFDAKFGSAYSDQTAYNPYHSRVHLTNDFLDILPGVITDSHFNDRGRLGRLVNFIGRWRQDHGQDLMGIGVEANTAFCIDPAGNGQVFGETVTLIQATATSQLHCTSGEPLRFTDLEFTQLLHDAVYDLDDRQLLENGDWLYPRPPVPTTPVFNSLVLDGSLESTMDSGAVTVTGMLGNDDNWWYGNLGTVPGSNRLPGTVVIPRLWSDYDYFANRIIGGQLANCLNAPLATIYLDDNCSATVSDQGLVTFTSAGYLLETFSATHVGVNDYNLPGIVGGRLHFFTGGDNYSLSDQYTASAVSGYDGVLSDLVIDSIGPNPFNPRTTINYTVSTAARVRVNIYSIRGQIVYQAGPFEVLPGHHVFTWDGNTFDNRNLSSGVYLIELSAGQIRQTAKLLLLK